MPEVSYTKGMPGVAPSSSGKKSLLRSVWKPLLAGLAIWGLVKLFDADNSASVGSVTAEAGLSGYALPVESGTPGVRVTWNAKKLSRGLNVVEYHIWRNDVAGPVLASRASEGNAFDDATAREVGYISADIETREEITGTTNVPAMTLGRPLKYYVSALYRVDTANGPEYYETTREETGQATPIAQILTSGLRQPLGGSQQNLHDVTFEWLSKRGADAYVIEVSTDPTFRQSLYVSEVVPFASSEGQSVRLQVKEALYSMFREVPSSQQIWWRIGARSTLDQPGPIPPAGRSNMRYIYSEVGYFYPNEVPPSPPTN
jgi:hypothetical protein